MELGGVVQKFMQLMGSIGRAALSTTFPSDFEYYSISFELTDYMDNTIDFLTFPIMPKSITKSENNRINVKKSASAVNVINSKSFTPHDITIKGNFGRSFVILVNVNTPNVLKTFKWSIPAGVRDVYDIDNSIVSTKSDTFNPVVKTGFGCTKILQSIINKSSGTDDKGSPFKLYFYNPALGEAYLVVPAPNSMTLMQNETQNNMMWEYTLNLIAIAPVLNNLTSLRHSATNILSSDIIGKGISATVSTVAKLI